MSIRTFKQMRDILIKEGFVKSSDDTITGENYDIWTKERFIEEVDNYQLGNYIKNKNNLLFKK